MTNGHPNNTFTEPFDLKTINFPDKELIEVTEIGKIIWNLESQTTFLPVYDETKESKEAYVRDSIIKKIMPTLIDSQNFWLKIGLEKCHSKRDLVTYHGDIFEIDPEYQKRMDESNERLEEIDQDYQRMNNASWKSAKDVMLGC